MVWAQSNAVQRNPAQDYDPTAILITAKTDDPLLLSHKQYLSVASVHKQAGWAVGHPDHSNVGHPEDSNSITF